jgi:colanic acid biosynthesis glycosyl transferase WcaI
MFVPHAPSTIKRLLSDASFLFTLTLLGRRAWSQADVIVTTCPMFGQSLAMRFATPFRSVPKLVIVQDFVVDAALELGMIKSRFLGRVLKDLERWAFRSCSTLTTISGEMLKKLSPIVGADRRTVFIPNWIHDSLAKSIHRRRKDLPIRKKNLLFYSGNVGRKQGLPDFLATFDGSRSGWRIRINGSGAEFDLLKGPCTGRTDVSLHGLEEENSYIDSLLTCSACLITQKPGAGANFLPSKILPALASGTPILAVCEADSPLGREVKEANCGVVIDVGNSSALNAVLQSWGTDPNQLNRYSENALVRARRYERSVILDQYRKEILMLAGRNSSERQARQPLELASAGNS